MFKTKGLALLMVLVIVLAGCGNVSSNSQQAADNKQTNNKEASSTAPTAEDQAKAAWPRTITDDTGASYLFDKRPERVAILHPLYMDYLFALDVTPTASLNAEQSLAQYETLRPFQSAAVAELGTGREVNVEKVTEMNPDVIITFIGQVDSIYEELLKVAPVIQFDYSNTWDHTTRLFGELLGEEQKSEQLIQETMQLIADTRTKLESLKDKTFLLLRANEKGTFTAQGSKNTIYYNPTVGFALKAPEGYPENGEALSLEGLSEMDADYIIIQHEQQVAKAAVEQNEPLAVWQSLKAIKNDQLYFFDNSLNTGSILAVRLAAKLFTDIAES